jgi:SOS-response transcriptional repressor LexA
MDGRRGVTDRWQLVLDFIKAYIKRHGVSPSYEVMAKSLGLKSKANMHRIVKRLEKEGHLKVAPRRFYGVKVVDRSIDEVISL